MKDKIQETQSEMQQQKQQEIQQQTQEIRKNYIDNLRWACILLLIPFHCATAWNSWGESNYIWFYESAGFSTFIILISPWYMALLFVLAGMSTNYSLQKRTFRKFIQERILKLFVPLVTGMMTVVALMAYYADKFHNGYTGSFFAHYRVFFTKFTDLSGYDGGWTPGHLWFLLYLFLVSMIFAGPIAWQKKHYKGFSCKKLSVWKIALFVSLPMVCYPILNFGGKSIGFYAIMFLLGYYVISEDDVVEKIVKYRRVNFIIMILVDLINVYLFIWAKDTNRILNTITMYMTCCFGILTILGYGRDFFNQRNRITKYLTSHSFLFYIFHFMWLVLFQFYLSKFMINTAILFIVSVLGTFFMTFLTSEIIFRIPGVNLLFGVKKNTRK